MGLPRDIPVDHLPPITDNCIPFEKQLLGPAEVAVFIYGTSMTVQLEILIIQLYSDRLTKS